MKIKHAKIILALLIAALTLALCGCSGGDIQPPTETDAADIFADVQATELIEKAAKENCTVFSMKERDESLESFYMNLIGGGAQ